MLPFNDHDIDTVALHCEKLHPEARIILPSAVRNLVIFPEHGMCLMKTREELSFDNGETFKETTVYVLHEWNSDLPRNQAIGDEMNDPWCSIEEAVFGIIALATCQLTAEQANQLHYEPDPTITRH